MLKVYIKMDKIIIKFGNTEIEKQKILPILPILMNNIDINNIRASNKVSFGKEGFKYFIGYKDVKKIDLYAYFFQK